MFSQQQQQQQQTNAVRKVTAMAFDAKNPAALLLPVAPSSDNNTNNDRIVALQINTIFSHTGVGCNEHEIAALSQIMDAHERHSEVTPAKLRRSWHVLKALSKAYRGALRDCLFRWEDNLLELEEANNNDDMTDNNNDNNATRLVGQQQHLDVEHLELLKLVYAVAHLSEIFLLPPPSDVTSTASYNDNLFDIPGGLTADLVRYLRHHHTVDALQQVDPDVLQELRGSMHPDQVDNGEPYWKLMNTFVQRGNLEQAWALLSRHSLCRRAADAAVYDDNNDAAATDGGGNHTMEEHEEVTLEKVREGFADLQRILCSAPLPGGRDDADDIDLGPVDGEEDGAHNESNKPNHDIMLENVEPDGYKRWETSRTADSSGYDQGSDFPLKYTPLHASRVFENWKQYILDLPSIAQLKRRIPQLETMLDILMGKLKGMVFDNWAEHLLTELIYQNPMIRPVNIHVRAKKLMAQYSNNSGMNRGEMNEVLLNIMQGNAGSAIEVLFAVGGGSGAALPATMTSLLCNLFMDGEHDLPVSLQTELLKAGAFALSSSLASTSSDAGARLAVRLLLPFAKPSADPSIVATLGETLSRHTPSSDLEAKNLIQLCRPLVGKESVRVLDGCVSLVLSRYRSYLANNRPSGALHWLLVGIELETLLCLNEEGELENFQNIEACSTCYRHLVTWCASVAASLLRDMMDEKEGLGYLYATATDMVKASKEGPLEDYATMLPEVQTLELVLGIYDGLTNKDDWTSVARNITLCMQEEPRDFDDGVVASLAPRSMHWDLLQLGQLVLERDEKLETTSRSVEFSPSFDVKGIQVLLEQLTKISLSLELECEKPLPADVVQKMKLSLGNGLKRAFVAENALRKPDRSRDIDAVFISQIKSVDLNKASLGQQERVVQRMLDI